MEYKMNMVGIIIFDEIIEGPGCTVQAGARGGVLQKAYILLPKAA